MTKTNVAEMIVKNADTQIIKAAVKFYKEAGKAKAFAEFSDPNSLFTFRSLYVFVIDMHGLILAHGADKKLIGKNLLGLKDSDGKPFIKQLIDTAKVKKNGWIEYKWMNSLTKKLTPKQTYFQREGDYIFAGGITKVSK